MFRRLLQELSAAEKQLLATREPALSGPELRYQAAPNPSVLEMPDLAFPTIDRSGSPNTTPAYCEAVSALYSLAYALRFALTKAGQPDHRVSRLEGLWWAEDMPEFCVERNADWRWTMSAFCDSCERRHASMVRIDLSPVAGGDQQYVGP